jgi:hypothetical protein
MRPLMKQIAELIGVGIRDRLNPILAKQSTLEARIETLEAKAGIEPKAGGSPRILRSPLAPHETPGHQVGDVVRVAGGENWECVGPNRWRKTG